MTTRPTWKDQLQVATPKVEDKRRTPVEVSEALPRRLRVIVREGRASRTEPIVQLALRLPESLATRIDAVTAGQRHGAILKILAWSLDELERQDIVLDK